MNLDIKKERMEFLDFASAPLPGYWCERQEREFAVWCAAKARATPSPAPIQQTQQDSCIAFTTPCKECNGRGLIGFLTSLRCQYCEGTGRAPTVKASQSDTHPIATARNEKD